MCLRAENSWTPARSNTAGRGDGPDRGRSRPLTQLEAPPPMQGMDDHWQGGERKTSRKGTPTGESRRAIGWLRSEIDAGIASRPRATESPDDRRRDPAAF